MPAIKHLSDLFDYTYLIYIIPKEKANAIDLAHRLNKYKIHPVLRKLDERMADYFIIVAYRTHDITHFTFS